VYNLIEESKAEIVINDRGCPTISFSRTNFKSILSNLLTNAIKYRDSERALKISIRCYSETEYSVLEVEDNGLGIKKENISKIFEMFRRIHHHVEGSGIGLYIVKRIVDNSGGKIEVDSVEGKGTRFRVYFKKVSQFHLTSDN